LVLYTAIDSVGQADIWSYNLRSGDRKNITQSNPESEYSATVTPSRARFSAIRVEPDSTQRLWTFESGGTNPELLLPSIQPVGYHAWLDEDRLALFVLGNPATLQIASVSQDAGRVVAEDIGLYKFDILSQRGLGKIKEAVEIVRYNKPEIPPIDIHDIKRFKEDKKIKFLLKNAKAIGCFYVESPAMRMLLKKLQVDNYLGLVAASSVIRPGVAKSGMMREYILRYRHPERRKDAHPILLKIMPETYGVMVYQ